MIVHHTTIVYRLQCSLACAFCQNRSEQVPPYDDQRSDPSTVALTSPSSGSRIGGPTTLGRSTWLARHFPIAQIRRRGQLGSKHLSRRTRVSC